MNMNGGTQMLLDIDIVDLCDVREALRSANCFHTDRQTQDALEKVTEWITRYVKAAKTLQLLESQDKK